MATSATSSTKEVFDLLRDDLQAIEREFGQETLSDVHVITEIGEYLRAGGGKAFAPGIAAAFCEIVWMQGALAGATRSRGGDYPHGHAGS